MKPRKLVRDGIKDRLENDEFIQIEDVEELNELYSLKVIEELDEIRSSKHQDITEFGDLMQVVMSYAESNGFTKNELFAQVKKKRTELHSYTNCALTNLDPDNPSNQMYLHKDTDKEIVVWGIKKDGGCILKSFKFPSEKDMAHKLFSKIMSESDIYIDYRMGTKESFFDGYVKKSLTNTEG